MDSRSNRNTIASSIVKSIQKGDGKNENQQALELRRIDAKDKKFDTDLAAFEAERNAIKQEMETLKNVAKENVERTFKLFS